MSLHKTYSTLVILLVACTAVGKSSETSFPFFKGSLEELKSTAKKLEKPYFVYFHNDKVASKEMDSCWYNDELHFYVDRNFLAFRMDISNQTHDLLTTYELQAEHVYLFFDADGQVMGFQEGALSADELLSLLQTFLFQLGDPMRVFYSHRKPPTSTDIQIATTEGMVEDKVGSSRAHKLPLISERLKKYSLDRLDGKEEETFAIHLETFKNEAQAISALERYERLWKGEIWVHQQEENGQFSYEILLGSYPNKQKAGYFASGIERLTEKKVKILLLSTLLK